MTSMNLVIIGWEEVRGVLARKPSDGSRVDNLVPTVNTTVLVHARLQDGPPFTITFDGEVFWSAVAPFLPDFQPSWDHVYLLGWYDETGKPFLSTWSGDRPIRSFVVTGSGPSGPPICGAPIPGGAKLHLVPAGKAPQEHAKELGGHHAIGWYLPRVDRSPKRKA